LIGAVNSGIDANHMTLKNWESIFSILLLQRKNTFLSHLISGKLSSEDKERLNQLLYDYLSRYTRKIVDKPLPINRKDFSMIPPYSDELYDLIVRILRKPDTSRFIPRFLDVYLAKYIFNPQELKDIKDILDIDDHTYLLCAKFCRDIVGLIFGKKIPPALTPLMSYNRSNGP
jgi:hypothetical protein